MISKNILINIGLLILSGIIYLFYEKFFTNHYIENWPSIFLGIIIICIIVFCNIMGFYSSIMNIRKIYLTIIIYCILIISTFLVYNGISIIVNILENNKIISECSSIVFIGVIIVTENIISNILVNTIIIKK